ncbi:hypothetical protein LCGC14_2948870 [marine sediment metagenome]|uniref:Uncharacterized protein n=2 Tax=marine sediment metagenome TaxID=412755 RepID=A0A0F8XGF7_9ZZZZ
MKVNKIPIRPDKIGIDLVLCPKTNLYLQDLFCRRCAYFEFDNEKYIECSFTGHRYGKPDPVKDRLIKDLSDAFIRKLPIKDKKSPMINFTERLKEPKSPKAKEELLMEDLSQHLKKKAKNLHNN